MTLYEMNQIAYQQTPTMSKTEIRLATEQIGKFLSEHDSNYYMMLNAEGRYYTIYTYKQEHNSEKMAEEIIDVAKTLGILKGVEIEENMIEIWIQHDSVCTMYGVFDYEKGVIEI